MSASNRECIEQLEKEIDMLKKTELDSNRYGREYAGYYFIPLKDLEVEYDLLSRREFILRFIVAERKAVEKRRNGINCWCTGSSICAECCKD